MLCRSAAEEISSLQPILQAHGVRLVGVGVGYNSLDGFAEGKFWKGELYVDVKKKLYAALKLGQGSLRMMMAPDVRKAYAVARKKNINGNLSGDGLQLGGTYVVDKGGKVLLEFQQKQFGQIPLLQDILRASGIDESPPPSMLNREVVCDSDVCAMPQKRGRL